MEKLQINHKRKVTKWRTECKIEIHMVFRQYTYILCTPMVVSIFQVKQKELRESLTQLLLRPSEAIQYWITASKGHAEQNTIFLLIAVSLQKQFFFTIIKPAKCYSGRLDSAQDLSPTADASNKYRRISRNAISTEVRSVFPIRSILE